MGSELSRERYLRLVKRDPIEGEGVGLCIWMGEVTDLCGLPCDNTRRPDRRRRGRCTAAGNATLQMKCKGFKLDQESFDFWYQEYLLAVAVLSFEAERKRWYMVRRRLYENTEE